MRSLALFSPLIALMAIIFAGAGTAYLKGRNLPRANDNYSVSSSGEEKYPKTIQSPDATVLTLLAPPRRVLALSTGAEEIIVELSGPEVLAGISRFTRNPRYSNVVDEVASIPKTIVGNRTEQIVRLHPDLVLISNYTDRRARNLLERCGIEVFPLPEPKNIQSIQETIGIIGQILGKEERAFELLASMQARLNFIRDKLPSGRHPEIIHLSDTNPLWVYGSQTVIGEIIKLAGCRNLAVEKGITGFKNINRESIARWDPEWILLEEKSKSLDFYIEQFKRDPILSNLSCLHANKIIAIPSRKLTSVSHHVIDAVEMLFGMVYGDESKR